MASSGNEGAGTGHLIPPGTARERRPARQGKAGFEADTWVQIPALPFPSWVLGPLILSEPWLPHL